MDNTYEVLWDGQKAGTVHVYDKGLMRVYESVCAVSTKKILRLCAECSGKRVCIGILAPEGGKLSIRRSFSKNGMREKGLEDTERFVLISEAEELTYTVQEAPSDVPEQEPEPCEPEEKWEPVPERDLEDVAMETPEMTVQDTEVEAVESVDEPASAEAVYAFPGTQEQEPEADQEPVLASEPDISPWRIAENPAELFSDEELKHACENISGALIMDDGQRTLLAVPVVTGKPFPMMPVFCLGCAENIAGREYIVFRIEEGRPVT